MNDRNFVKEIFFLFVVFFYVKNETIFSASYNNISVQNEFILVRVNICCCMYKIIDERTLVEFTCHVVILSGWLSGLTIWKLIRNSG